MAGFYWCMSVHMEIANTSSVRSCVDRGETTTEEAKQERRVRDLVDRVRFVFKTPKSLDRWCCSIFQKLERTGTRFKIDADEGR